MRPFPFFACSRSAACCLTLAWAIHTFVEIQQCQLCNTKATMPSLCLTAKVQEQGQKGCSSFLFLPPLVVWHTKIAHLRMAFLVFSTFFSLFHFCPPLILFYFCHLFHVAFYARNLHCPLCWRLLHFCFFYNCCCCFKPQGKKKQKNTKIMTLKCAFY